jgi:hypothetical protein
MLWSSGRGFRRYPCSTICAHSLLSGPHHQRTSELQKLRDALLLLSTRKRNLLGSAWASRMISSAGKSSATGMPPTLCAVSVTQPTSMFSRLCAFARACDCAKGVCGIPQRHRSNCNSKKNKGFNGAGRELKIETNDPLPRHTQSELVTFPGTAIHGLGRESSVLPLNRQGDDLPFFPNVDRNTVHTGSPARVLGSSAQSTPYLRCSRGDRPASSLDLHSLLSSSRGSRPEMSYTVHTSASIW